MHFVSRVFIRVKKTSIMPLTIISMNICVDLMNIHPYMISYEYISLILILINVNGYPVMPSDHTCSEWKLIPVIWNFMILNGVSVGWCSYLNVLKTSSLHSIKRFFFCTGFRGKFWPNLWSNLWHQRCVFKGQGQYRCHYFDVEVKNLLVKAKIWMSRSVSDPLCQGQIIESQGHDPDLGQLVKCKYVL
jgi:hypothetical protein